MSMPRVSIIIPAKNEARYIENCLESIFQGDYPREDYEVIVIDNGSTDITKSIAQSLGAKVFNKPELSTISALRNFGAQMSLSPVLCFLDADCTVSKEWLRNAEKYFHKTDISCFGSSPGIPSESTWVELTWFLVRETPNDVFERNWQESTNMFIRKEIFEKAGRFNEKLITCEDVDLSYRLRKLGKIISDFRIRAIHHRDPKTLKDFFNKERWRGKSNYQGFFQHGLRFDELPSLILPIYYLLMFLFIIVLLVNGKFIYFIAAFVLWQLPLLTLTYLKYTKKQLNLLIFLKLLLLYNVYFFARGIAVF